MGTPGGSERNTSVFMARLEKVKHCLYPSLPITDHTDQPCFKQRLATQGRDAMMWKRGNNGPPPLSFISPFIFFSFFPFLYWLYFFLLLFCFLRWESLCFLSWTWTSSNPLLSLPPKQMEQQMWTCMQCVSFYTTTGDKRNQGWGCMPANIAV